MCVVPNVYFLLTLILSKAQMTDPFSYGYRIAYPLFSVWVGKEKGWAKGYCLDFVVK